MSPPDDAGLGTARGNGASHPEPPPDEPTEWPEFLIGVWDKLDAACHKRLRGPWEGENLNHRTRTGSCVRMLHHHGMTLEQTVEAASYFPRGLGQMLDHAALIRELWAEMLADEEKANIPTRLVKLLSVHAWIERDIPAPDQILGDVLTAGGRMFLIGRTGLGKTQLALGCGTGFATGEGFLHWRCTKPKRVLIIDGEMPEGLIKARAIDAMRRINDKPQPENLIIYSRYLEDEFVELFPEIGKMPPLNTEEGRIWVLALVDALGGADVVIFDNVMSLTIGDQKDEVSWSGVMPLVQELTARNIAQLWLDHTGHNTERQYGSSTKAWPFDSSGIMAPLKEDQCCDREVAFTLSFEFPGKARRRTPDNWHDFETCIIRLKDDRWLSEPVNKATSRLGSVPKSREVFYDALAAAIGKSAVGAGRATLAAWELECQRRSLIEPAPETEDHKQRSGRLALFRASKSALLSARWIAIQDDLVTDLRGRWA